MNARRISFCIFTVALGASLPLFGARTPTRAVAQTHPTTAHATTAAATRPISHLTSHAATHPAANPSIPVVRTNPFLPPAVPVESFFIDMSMVQKLPTVTPSGFAPLYTSQDWKAFRDRFGAEAEEVAKGKSTAVSAFGEKLLAAASEPNTAPGLQRLLTLRAAVMASRSKDGYPVADKAVAAYLGLMDKKSASQVGALWSVANGMARTSVTPKEDRIRYDAIAARANMQLALLLLDTDQVAAADSMIKQVGYHEGWLKKDATTRGLIAQVRAEVKQSAGMMEYLASLYQPAMHNDVQALTTVYLFGRYVKGDAGAVSNIPVRVPGSTLSQLATAIDTASAEHPAAAFAAAEQLRSLAIKIPDALIRARALHAALQLYDVYLTSPLTERERVNRTLARIAREGVISDGARRSHAIDPFPPPAPATAPATKPAAVVAHMPPHKTPATAPATAPAIAHAGPSVATPVTLAPVAPVAPVAPTVVPPSPGKNFVLPPEENVADLERAVLRDGHQPWHLDAALAAQAAAAWVAQDDNTPEALRGMLMGLTDKTPKVTAVSPDHSEAMWDDNGKHIAVALIRTKPAPEKGIWIAQHVAITP